MTADRNIQGGHGGVCTGGAATDLEGFLGVGSGFFPLSYWQAHGVYGAGHSATIQPVDAARARVA